MTLRWLLILSFASGFGACAISNPGGGQPNEGREIFTRTCTACHRSHSVSEYTMEEWAGIVDEMAPRAKLDARRQAVLMAYISKVRSGS